MAELARDFEELGCWESATEEENIIVYGMDFTEKTLFVIFTDDAGKTPVDPQSPLVVACYNEDYCFKWGKELENFAAFKELCKKHKPGSVALLQALATYELPKH